MRCRDTTVKRWRAKFLRARAEHVKIVGQRMRGHGAYSDKLVGLTVPHEGDASERIEWFRRAFAKFRRWFADHMPRFLGGRKPGRVWQQTSYESRGGHWRNARLIERRGYAWTRAIEWVDSSDGAGHPHAHIWALCPYLPQWEMTRAWRAALASSDPPYKDASAWPIPIRVDIRRVRRARDVAAELIKYVTKDLRYESDGSSRLVPPYIYAQVYELFAGTRRTQSSRGFMARAGLAPCTHCGSRRVKQCEMISARDVAKPVIVKRE
jgi:hypothetical protein